MLRYVTQSIMLLMFLVVIVCGIYPFTLWMIGQTIFPFQANGSILFNANGKPVGSKLIAQPFTQDEYFQPRPSAAAYDATVSASSALAASNYALRDRIARAIGPLAQYQNGQLVGSDIEKWFQEDKFQGKPNIVAQWTVMHPTLAQAVKFPLSTGTDIQAIFFDMWRQEHPDVALKHIPGDYVTTSGSGLDPHITLQNAEFQLDRVAAKWAANLKRDPVAIKNEIRSILQKNTQTPLAGLAGESFVNVLEVNLELHKHFL